MVTCGTQYGVFINGTWHWFTDYHQASQVEAEQLYGKVKRKLEAGQTVILTHEMWQQGQQAQSEKEAA